MTERLCKKSRRLKEQCKMTRGMVKKCWLNLLTHLVFSYFYDKGILSADIVEKCLKYI